MYINKNQHIYFREKPSNKEIGQKILHFIRKGSYQIIQMLVKNAKQLQEGARVKVISLLFFLIIHNYYNNPTTQFRHILQKLLDKMNANNAYIKIGLNRMVQIQNEMINGIELSIFSTGKLYRS